MGKNQWQKDVDDLLDVYAEWKDDPVVGPDTQRLLEEMSTDLSRHED